MQTLYLSKNCLRSLQGIQQFGALVTLALADNLIDSFDQLGFLLMASQGHTLRALSLEGNPIARLPNYRSAGNTVACIHSLVSSSALCKCCLSLLGSLLHHKSCMQLCTSSPGLSPL